MIVGIGLRTTSKYLTAGNSEDNQGNRTAKKGVLQRQRKKRTTPTCVKGGVTAVVPEAGVVGRRHRSIYLLQQRQQQETKPSPKLRARTPDPPRPGEGTRASPTLAWLLSVQGLSLCLSCVPPDGEVLSEIVLYCCLLSSPRCVWTTNGSQRVSTRQHAPHTHTLALLPVASFSLNARQRRRGKHEPSSEPHKRTYVNGQLRTQRSNERSFGCWLPIAVGERAVLNCHTHTMDAR